jgi:8-oxo-dGTP pyrophosphatase MutT (NUDIX family)
MAPRCDSPVCANHASAAVTWEPSEVDPAIPAKATHSGTVAVLRQGPGGLEVLMLRRTPSERDHFNGMWVFPGGTVEDVDMVPDELEQARLAAVREAAEEAGIDVALHALVPLDRWEPQPRGGLGTRRFSTWVFLASMEAADDLVRIDGVEVDQHRWIAPSDALAAHRSGEMGFVGPTWMTLNKLAQHRHVDDAIAWARRRQPVRYYSQVHVGDDATPTVIAWHGDELYDGTPGGRHRLTMAPGNWTFEGP